MVVTTVVGARGYLGRELVRLLLGHPEVERVVPVSSTEAGQAFAVHVPAFQRNRLVFAAPGSSDALGADVVFLATPAGEAAALAQAHLAAGAATVIDLSRDHRLAALAGQDGWTYGLADLWPVVQGTAKVSNPGCYPTAAALAMAPALKAGLVAPGPLIVDGKSGVSGAGASPRGDLHFPEMNESVRAYKVLGHDHGAEIAACAGRLNGSAHAVRFTPHLVPQTRGLLCTTYLPVKTGTEPEAVRAAYEAAYADTPFVVLVPEADTGDVRASNAAQVAVDLDTDTGLIVARCAIDNLRKGGSGTAVQNMNAVLGMPATVGLDAIGGNV